MIYQKQYIIQQYSTTCQTIQYYICKLSDSDSPPSKMLSQHVNLNHQLLRQMLTVESPEVTSNQHYVESTYTHKFTLLEQSESLGKINAKVHSIKYQFRTELNVGRVGLVMVGFAGNNGSTILGGILANKHRITWNDKKGQHLPNMYGSMTQCSTMKIGETQEKEIYMKIKDVIPMVDPKELVITGWDINNANLAEAMNRAQVFEYDLQAKLYPYMKQYTPLKSIYYPDFIASNQQQRANHLLEGDSKLEHFNIIKQNIKDFRKNHDLDKIIVLWTANTERFAEEIIGVNDTYEHLKKALANNHPEISPSNIFAMAALEEDCIFINGSPQNTFVQGLKDTPHLKGILIGNDFKTGQTKFKTSFIDFLTGSGIKPKSCVSYNHLGNNDGKNLSSEKQFRSKQISKSQCILDMLQNSQLYDTKTNAEDIHPDHTVVIKYVPSAGDSKKALDQYTSQIFMGGNHTFVSYNVCEDSLLAAGVIIDLIVLSELMSRVSYQKQNQEWKQIAGIVSFLGYLTKAPESKGPIINSLNRQRMCIENLLRVLTGLPLEDHLLLNYRL